MFLSPATLPAPPGGGVPRPDEICNPSSVFWVCPGASYQLNCPEHL